MTIQSYHCARCRAWTRTLESFKFVQAQGTQRPVCKDEEACKVRKAAGVVVELPWTGKLKKSKRIGRAGHFCKPGECDYGG
jgi:hypothetical protein